MTSARKRAPLREILRKRFPQYSKDTLFALTAAGNVYVDGVVFRDGGALVPVAAEIVLSQLTRSVSRGYDKLQAALRTWKLPVRGLVWIDAGASTGGFTSCLLSNGAKVVHAVDVGYNQLDYRLRTDERVQVWERCNIMDPQDYQPLPDVFCMDLSFRSALHPVRTLLAKCRQKWGIVLLKPQFEWDSPPDWFTGVVPDEYSEQVVRDALNRWEEYGISVQKRIPSPIRGRSGNQEYLVLATSPDSLLQQ